MQENKKKIKKIIVAQYLGMGDLVATEPLSRYLKQEYSNAQLYWASPKKYREILDSNPFIEDVIEVENVLEWYKSIKPTIPNDVLIFDLNLESSLKINFLNYYFFGSLLEIFCLSAGLPKLCEQPKLYLPKRIESEISKLDLPEKYIIIHRFSNGFARSLEFQKWDEILDYIVKNYKLHIIEIGGSDLINIPKPNIPNNFYIDLKGKLSIMETAAVIKMSDFFIGIDSGPAHLANAVKTKGVILFGVWNGRFKKYIPYCGFYRDPQNIRYVRNLNGPVKGIEIEKIIEAIDSLVYNKPYEIIMSPYDPDGNKLIENFLSSSNSFILWGASGSGFLYKSLLQTMGKEVVCFLDSDIKKNNTYFENVPVYHYSKLAESKVLNNFKIIISSLFWEEISGILEKKFNKILMKDYI